MNVLRKAKLALLIGFALTVTACGGGGSSAPTVTGTNFNVTTLEALLTGSFAAGVDINNSGFAVGLADNGSAVRGVIWDSAATPQTVTALAPLAGNDYSAAYGINSEGVSVGESANGATTVAVTWPAQSTVASALSINGLFAGASSAYDINSLGEIVGEAVNDASGNTVAVYWLDNLADPLILTNLGTLANAFSSAYAIGTNGVIVGESLDDQGAVQAVAWLPDGAGGFNAPVVLPSLTNHIAGLALDINESGQVVGESEALDGTVHAVVWMIDAQGAITGPEDIGPASSAAGINTLGWIAGYTQAATGSDSASIWNGLNLDDQQNVSPAFSQAYQINDSLQAVGVSGNQAILIKP